MCEVWPVGMVAKCRAFSTAGVSRVAEENRKRTLTWWADGDSSLDFHPTVERHPRAEQKGKMQGPKNCIGGLTSGEREKHGQKANK